MDENLPMEYQYDNESFISKGIEINNNMNLKFSVVDTQKTLLEKEYLHTGEKKYTIKSHAPEILYKYPIKT